MGKNRQVLREERRPVPAWLHRRMDRTGNHQFIIRIKTRFMEQFILLERNDSYSIIGGATTTEGRVARMLGRLVGAALKALYDILRNGTKPQSAPAI